MTVQGRTTSSGDLLERTIIDADAPFFSKDPTRSASAGAAPRSPTGRSRSTAGSPRATSGSASTSARTARSRRGRRPVEPIPDACLNDRARRPMPPTDCPKPLPADQFDGMPEVELFDSTGGHWHRLPHLDAGPDRTMSPTPARYVDPTTGTVLVRFVNDRQDQVGSSVDRRDHGDGQMTDIVATRGLVKRYDRHARGRRHGPDRRRGRDLRPRRARTAPARRPRCGSSRRC